MAIRDGVFRRRSIQFQHNQCSSQSTPSFGSPSLPQAPRGSRHAQHNKVSAKYMSQAVSEELISNETGHENITITHLNEATRALASQARDLGISISLTECKTGQQGKVVFQIKDSKNKSLKTVEVQKKNGTDEEYRNGRDKKLGEALKDAISEHCNSHSIDAEFAEKISRYKDTLIEAKRVLPHLSREANAWEEYIDARLKEIDEFAEKATDGTIDEKSKDEFKKIIDRQMDAGRDGSPAHLISWSKDLKTSAMKVTQDQNNPKLYHVELPKKAFGEAWQGEVSYAGHGKNVLVGIRDTGKSRVYTIDLGNQGENPVTFSAVKRGCYRGGAQEARSITLRHDSTSDEARIHHSAQGVMESLKSKREEPLEDFESDSSDSGLVPDQESVVRGMDSKKKSLPDSGTQVRELRNDSEKTKTEDSRVRELDTDLADLPEPESVVQDMDSDLEELPEAETIVRSMSQDDQSEPGSVVQSMEEDSLGSKSIQPDQVNHVEKLTETVKDLIKKSRTHPVRVGPYKPDKLGFREEGQFNKILLEFSKCRNSGMSPEDLMEVVRNSPLKNLSDYHLKPLEEIIFGKEAVENLDAIISRRTSWNPFGRSARGYASRLTSDQFAAVVRAFDHGLRYKEKYPGMDFQRYCSEYLNANLYSNKMK